MARTKTSKAKPAAKKEKAAPTIVKKAAAAPAVAQDSANQDWLTTAEAAEFLGCSVPLIYAMLNPNDGRLKNKKEIANRIYVSKKELQKLSDDRIVQPRKKKNMHELPQMLMRNSNTMVSFEVQASAMEYNLLTMALAPQGLTIEQWVTKMIAVAAENAQKATSNLVASSGS